MKRGKTIDSLKDYGLYYSALFERPYDEREVALGLARIGSMTEDRETNYVFSEASFKHDLCEKCEPPIRYLPPPAHSNAMRRDHVKSSFENIYEREIEGNHSEYLAMLAIKPLLVKANGWRRTRGSLDYVEADARFLANQMNLRHRKRCNTCTNADGPDLDINPRELATAVGDYLSYRLALMFRDQV